MISLTREELFRGAPYLNINLSLPRSMFENANRELIEHTNFFTEYSYGDRGGWKIIEFDHHNLPNFPATAHLIKALPFKEIFRMRALLLEPGGWVGWHTEPWESQQNANEGTIITTFNLSLDKVSGASLFFQNGVELMTDQGQIISINFSRWHSAANNGKTNRYHLKITGAVDIVELRRICENKFINFESVEPWDKQIALFPNAYKAEKRKYKNFWGIASGTVFEKIIDVLSDSDGLNITYVDTNLMNLKFKEYLIQNIQRISSYKDAIESFAAEFNLKKIDWNHHQANTLAMWLNFDRIKSSFEQMVGKSREIRYLHLPEGSIQNQMLSHLFSDPDQSFVIWADDIFNRPHLCYETVDNLNRLKDLRSETMVFGEIPFMRCSLGS